MLGNIAAACKLNRLDPSAQKKYEETEGKSMKKPAEMIRVQRQITHIAYRALRSSKSLAGADGGTSLLYSLKYSVEKPFRSGLQSPSSS